MTGRTALLRAHRAGLSCLGASLLLLIAACSDTERPQLVTGPAAVQTVTADLDTQIQATIDAVFPRGQANVASVRWRNVKRQSMKNASGRKQFVELVDWIQKKTGELIPPNGETQEHAAARLVLLMSLYVYGGPDTPPPPITTETDAALGLVTPAAPDTVQTPSEHAAVVFPKGAVNEPTIVVITQETTYYPATCSGPLDTRLCQYPQFYKYNVFPDVKLNIPAQVAFCHVNSGDARRPLVDHDRLRFAHERPDPANYTPGSTIVDNIEILPYRSAGSITNCEQGDDYTKPVGPTGALKRALKQAARLASSVTSVFAVKEAWAIDGIGVGDVSFFSTFGVVDPQSQPNLQPGASLGLSTLEAAPGDQITVNAWSLSNTGTGPAPASDPAVILAQDTSLTSGEQLFATLPAAGALEPGDAANVAAYTITIPEATEAGTYFLGVRVDSHNQVDESSKDDNFVSVRVIVAPKLASANAITTGERFTCALNTIGQAYCWGLNNNGQLGNGTFANSATPVAVQQGPLRFTQISAAGPAACALTRDGDAYCWGNNDFASLGTNAPMETCTATVVIRNPDGSQTTTTRNFACSNRPRRVSSELPFRAIAVGNQFGCALDMDGAARCWGRNSSGQLGRASTDTGRTLFVPQAVVGGHSFVKLYAGLWDACGIDGAAQAWCWGDNSLGTIGVADITDTRVSTPVQVPAPSGTWGDLKPGAGNNCGISASRAYCWGSTFWFGAIGDGQTTHPPTSPSIMRTPSEVHSSTFFGSVAPGTGNNVLDDNCALTKDGAAYCWGANNSGQLGTTATTATCNFNAQINNFGCTGNALAVSGGFSFRALAVGSAAACGISTEHEVVCWGANDVGQLGDGTTSGPTGRSTPTVVAGIRAP